MIHKLQVIFIETFCNSIRQLWVLQSNKIFYVGNHTAHSTNCVYLELVETEVLVGVLTLVLVGVDTLELVLTLLLEE